MTHPLVGAFGEEIAGILSALLGTPTTSDATVPPATGEGWTIVVTAEAPAKGAWTVFIGNAGATAVATDILGLAADEAAPGPAVGETLREALGQAISALCQRDVARGATLRVGDPAVAAAPPAQDVLATFTITCGTIATPVSVTVCGGIEPPAGQTTMAAPTASVAAVPQPMTAAAAAAAMGIPAGSDRLDAILDIELPLIVRFGRTELPLRTLAHLGPGSLIDLGRSADDPVDLLVSNRVVARGEVVVVGGNYGVRVLDVVSPRERARSMEG
jgi:flagellar motor switch protein FliN/FliY